MSPSDFTNWLASPDRTLIMGVLNVTPDSFSDGGELADVSAAVERAKMMLADGADVIDIGGESTRPGAARVDAAEQVRRVADVVEGVAKTGVAISIDTTRAAVAAAALDAGAAIINDVSAGRDDPDMFPLAAERQCPIILMHMLGSPGTMQQNPTYADVVADVLADLLARAALAEAAGVKRKNILIDPGIGFGKTVSHNLALLRNMDRFVATNYRVLVGTSRKGFIGQILGRPNPKDRLFGTAASVAWAVSKGAHIVRVHDVAEMSDVVKIVDAIKSS